MHALRVDARTRRAKWPPPGADLVRPQRTQPECDWLEAKIGPRAAYIELTCKSGPVPNFTLLTKLLWVRTHQPEIFGRIAHVLCPKDYIRYKMTGEYAIDMQEASGTLLLDVTHRRWSTEVAEAAGIPMEWLPRLFEGPEICARISHAGAAATGLTAGIPVAAGAGDQGAGAVGMGIVGPGSVSATIGTSGVVFASTDRPAMDPLGRLHTFCHAAPGLWHVMGVTNGAGLSLRWFRDTFATGFPYDLLTEDAARVPAGSDGLLWAPYLFGERTPHLDPLARAAFVGLTASHTRAHCTRAIMEGVAMSLRDTFSLFAELSIPIARISAREAAAHAVRSGGRSRLTSTAIRSNSLPRRKEGGAFGAALLAAVGIGEWPTRGSCMLRHRPRR